MKKIYTKIKPFLIVLSVLLYFGVWHFVRIAPDVQNRLLYVLVGICSVEVLFGILLKYFDAKKTVSSFFLLSGAVTLLEITLFLATNWYAYLGKYGFVLSFVFKNVRIMCLIGFYRKYFGKKVVPERLMILVSLLCDAACVWHPEFAIYLTAVMAVMGIWTFVKIYGARKRKNLLFLCAHLLVFGGIVSCYLEADGACGANIIACRFISIALADVLWTVLYMKVVVKMRNEEVRHAEKKLDRKSEEMNAMLSQIKPHFLYNTLNTIQYLCRTDGELAADTISDFSDYLRTNLNFDSNRQIVPFNEELEHVNKYLRIEKLRFKHRLMVKYDIREEDFLVPTLSLQPIIENAVKHGISKRLNGGTITITTYMGDDDYVIEIKDNGVGFTEKERQEKEKNPKRKSLGLKNIQNRIENLLDGRLEIVSRKERGTTATIYLPIEKNLEEMDNENSLY